MKRKIVLACVAIALCAATAKAQDEYMVVKKTDGTTAEFVIGDVEKVYFVTVQPTVEAVDLGLTSGTKWATCNVGATAPEDYGGYYAWGETEEETDYSWANYAYAVLDADGELSECTEIGSDIAGTAYDVAHVKWGGTWKMPTKAQLQELCDECKWEWTTLNEVNGYLVKGGNGNSIFLPAAGIHHDTTAYYAGSSGNYWSSTAFAGYPKCAYSMDFDSKNCNWFGDIRYYGQSVRPVTE